MPNFPRVSEAETSEMTAALPSNILLEYLLNEAPKTRLRRFVGVSVSTVFANTPQ